jgi:hypothetical protein
VNDRCIFFHKNEKQFMYNANYKMQADDEFEKVYHRLMNQHIHSSEYEHKLYTCMVVYPDETCNILEPFLHLFNSEELLKTWWEMIKYQHIKEHKLTFGQRKERRLLIRKVYRIAQLNVKVMRILDLVIQHVHLIESMAL